MPILREGAQSFTTAEGEIAPLLEGLAEMGDGFGLGCGLESIDRVAEVLLDLGSFASDLGGGMTGDGGFGTDFANDIGNLGDRLGISL